MRCVQGKWVLWWQNPLSHSHTCTSCQRQCTCTIASRFQSSSFLVLLQYLQIMSRHHVLIQVTWRSQCGLWLIEHSRIHESSSAWWSASAGLLLAPQKTYFWLAPGGWKKHNPGPCTEMYFESGADYPPPSPYLSQQHAVVLSILIWNDEDVHKPSQNWEWHSDPRLLGQPHSNMRVPCWNSKFPTRKLIKTRFLEMLSMVFSGFYPKHSQGTGSETFLWLPSCRHTRLHIMQCCSAIKHHHSCHTLDAAPNNQRRNCWDSTSASSSSTAQRHRLSQQQ